MCVCVCMYACMYVYKYNKEIYNNQFINISTRNKEIYCNQITQST